MIIERCRELALRAPARVVFPDALDQRVLKAAQYLHQQGLATPILVANPFELRQFALSHGVAMDGLQVIDPHGNLAMREEFAHRWLARRDGISAVAGGGSGHLRCGVDGC